MSEVKVVKKGRKVEQVTCPNCGARFTAETGKEVKCIGCDAMLQIGKEVEK